MVIGYHFFCRFPSGAIPRGIWRYALGLLYVAGVVVVAAGLGLQWIVRAGGAAEAARYVTLVPLHQVAGLWVFVTAVIAMLAVIPFKYRGLAGDDERRRVRWVAYASSVALAPSVWYPIVAMRQGGVGPGLELFAESSSVAIPICMAYAVVKHRVLDIGVVVRRGLKYLLARRVLQWRWRSPSSC